MISTTIDQEIKQAMLAKDQVKLRGLRAIKAAILLAKTEKGQAEEINEEAEIKILQKLVKQRKESADIYKTQGRDDLYQVEQEEIDVIAQFLPKQMERSEIEAVIAKIIAETGAGQHGVATATVCALLDLECTVFMGEIDIARQAPNVARMQMLGAKVIPATSGSKTLKDATNEAIRYWINNPETFYIIGSVVGPHPYPAMVTKFQSIISEEIRFQLNEKYGKETPDYVIACVGGGSNAAGAFYHFLDDGNVKLIAVEAAGLGVESGETAATTIKGTEGIIHGSRTLLMQDKDGQIVEPYSISAGLDYPGVGPLHAHLFKTGRAEFLNATDDEALEAAFLLTKIEGIIPALESSHALAALEKMNFKPQDIVVLNLSGRGDKDLETYMKVSEKYS